MNGDLQRKGKIYMGCMIHPFKRLSLYKIEEWKKNIDFNHFIENIENIII